jgi:hypothetical protein
MYLKPGNFSDPRRIVFDDTLMYFVTFWCGKCQTGSVVTVQSQFECDTIKIKFLVMTLQLLRLVDLMCFCSKRADDVEKDC